MSALLNHKKRAKARKDRRARGRAILDAGRHMFVRQPYDAVTLDSVGRRVGAAKGLASLHYPTKEDLFLAVLKNDLAAWFDELERKLDSFPTAIDAGVLAAMLADDLAERGDLTRLLSLLHNVVEQNVEVLPAQLFADWLRGRALALAATLERRCAAFGPGDGAAFLRRLAVVVAGLRQTANPSGVFALILQDDDLGPFRTKLGDELRAMIERILPRS